MDIRRRVGFVTEDKEMYPYMTVAQIIRFTRSFFPKWRDDLERRYLKLFDLSPKKIPDLSKGMRSKLMLLLGIARGADLLILDEPTDGFDPVAMEDVLRELVGIAASERPRFSFLRTSSPKWSRSPTTSASWIRGNTIVSGPLDDMKTGIKATSRSRIRANARALARRS